MSVLSVVGLSGKTNENFFHCVHGRHNNDIHWWVMKSLWAKEKEKLKAWYAYGFMSGKVWDCIGT